MKINQLEEELEEEQANVESLNDRLRKSQQLVGRLQGTAPEEPDGESDLSSVIHLDLSRLPVCVTAEP